MRSSVEKYSGVSTSRAKSGLKVSLVSGVGGGPRCEAGSVGMAAMMVVVDEVVVEDEG